LPDDEQKQVELHAWGNLPNPCIELRSIVNEPDKENKIEVIVYGIEDPGTVCTQVISPFDVTLKLGKLAAGKYTVILNDKNIGEFELP